MSSMIRNLPEGWQQSTLDEVAEIIRGVTFPSEEKQSEHSAGTVMCLRTSNIQDEIEWDDVLYIPSSYVKSDDRWLQPSDTLISMANSYELVGKVALLKRIPDRVTFGGFIAAIRTRGIDPKFLFFSLREPETKEWIRRSSSRTVNIANISLKTLQPTAILVPPIAEQRRIVAKIEALQERSRKAREALAEVGPLLEQFRQSLLAAAFRGDLTADWRAANPNVEPASELLNRIRQERRQKWEQAELAKYEAKGKQPPRGWEEKYDSIKKKAVRATVADIRADGVALDEVPIGWELVRLGDIASLQAGYAFQSKWFSKSGVRLLRGTNIEPGNTRWTDTVFLPAKQSTEYDEYQLKTGDVVIAMDRPVISTGLKVAKIKQSDIPALLLQRVGRFKIEDRIDLDFVYLFLQSPFFMRHIDVQATGTQLPHISANDIESAILPLPPLEEQAIIIARLTTALNATQQLEAIRGISEHDLGQLDQSILAKAFRGELVPQDPNDEPASVLLERIRADRQATASTKRKGAGNGRK